MASEIEGSFLTRKGNRLINKLLRAKGPLHITRACAGDGVMGPDEDPELFTELIHYVSDLAILGFLDSDGSDRGESVLALQATSIGVQHGYAVREIAVYAEDPDDGEILYAYASLQDNPPWIRPEKHAVTNLTDLNLVIIVDRIEKITVNLSINGLVTVGMLNQRLAPLELNTELVTLAHGLGQYPQVMAFAYQYGAGMGNGPAGGTNLMEIPTKVEYAGKDMLTIYTTKSAAKPGTEKALHKISDTEYVITYQDNDKDAVYIRLIPEQKETSFTKIATIPHHMGVYPGVFAAVVKYGAGVGGAGNGPAGGTSVKPLPVQVEYPDLNTISISSALTFDKPALRQINREEYTVTFEDNKSLSIYLRLLPNGGSTQVTGGISIPNTSMTAGDNVTVQNMVFSATAPEDKSLIWGKI